MPDPTAPYITAIVADAPLEVAAVGWASTIGANLAALQLSAAQNTEVQNAVTAFTSAMNGMVNQRNLAKNATDNKDLVKKSLKTVISKYAKIFNGNTAIPDNLLSQLQLPPHKPGRTVSAPSTPINVVASADGQGFVTLKWGRNGNTQVTVFSIEAQYVAGGDWTQIGSTTKAKYQFPATVGAYISLRIIASRNNQFSQPSIPVTLWGNGVSQAMLQVA